MENNLLITIVIPVYNVEKYIESCINSVLHQTYSNLEIIMVDDGSTDNSGVLCEKFARQDKRIKVVHQKNQGLSGARNAGINIANGNYLFFLDSDDFILNDTIEKLVKLSVENNADLVVCDNARCSDNETYEDYIARQKDIKTILIDEEQKMKIFLTESKIKVVAWGKLYKKFLFDKIRFPIGRYNEDNFTTYKIVHSAKRIVVTSFCGYIYRVSASSITNQSFKIKHWDDVEGKLEQLEFIEMNYPDLKNAAKAAVVYACNQVLFLMGASGCKDIYILDRSKKYYRKFEKYYLVSNAHVTGKFFSIIAYITPYLAIRVAKLINKWSHD